MVISRYSDYWKGGKNRDGDSLEAFSQVLHLYDTNYPIHKDFLLRHECFSRISASFATFEPRESHAMHREVAVTVVGLSRRPG